MGFDELRAYFASLRAAFSNLRIVREQIIADGRFLAARITFSGTFTSVFTSSPIGPVEPTGQHVEWEVINTFRYDDGRLAEEWVQTGQGSSVTGVIPLRDRPVFRRLRDQGSGSGPGTAALLAMSGYPRGVSTLAVVGAGPKGIAVAAKARALTAAGLPAPRVVLVDRGEVAGNCACDDDIMCPGI